MKKWSVEIKVLAGFAFAFATLALTGALAYRATTTFIETSNAAYRSERALTALEGILSLMNEAESLQRGYIILGEAIDLAGREHAVAQIGRHVTDLKQSKRDDPVQFQRIPELEQRIAERMKLLNWVLEARRAEGYEAARERLLTRPGREEMRRLRELVKLMASEESTRLAQLRHEAEDQANDTLLSFGLLLIASLVFLSMQYFGIRREIYQRREKETELAHLVGELKSANEELKNFAYVVSHDLKAPLRAIGSLADWLTVDQADRLDDEGKEHLRLLVSRVRRMDGLIEGILDYSRVGRIKEQAVPVDLDRMVHEVIDSLAPPAHVAVTVQGPLPTIVIEKTRIQQVFQNLLSNAIKYLDKPEGRIEVRCTPQRDAWQFSVADNGPGIEPRHHERVFQLFQTLAPRDRVESTGVGLALVKKIVEMYGGHVWIESTPGAGSTFHFTLPHTAGQSHREPGK